MNNKVTITNNNNKVTITPQDNNLVTTESPSTPISITQNNTSVVTVNSPGPRGNTGATGLTGGNDLTTDILGRNITASGNMNITGTVESDGLILTSPNGTRFKITVENGGGLDATEL